MTNLSLPLFGQLARIDMILLVLKMIIQVDP